MPSQEELAALIINRQEKWFASWIARIARPPDDKLFHYTNADGLIGILRSRVFWGTDITHLNDSSELEYGMELVRRQLDEAARRRAKGKVAALLAAARENFHSFGGGLLTAYVSCFCQNGDLLSQWRGYGDSGGGYTIGIRPCRKGGTATPEPKISLRRVIYEPVEQLKLINESIAQLEAFADYAFADGSPLDWNEVGKQLTSFFRQEVGDYLWCFKNNAFSEEQEWRFLYLTGPADPAPRSTHFRPRPSGIVPYVELDLFNLRNADIFLDVCEIICGPTLDPDRSARTVQTLLRSLKYESVDVKPSRVPLRRFT
jgi:hypothetical protein